MASERRCHVTPILPRAPDTHLPVSLPPHPHVPRLMTTQPAPMVCPEPLTDAPSLRFLDEAATHETMRPRHPGTAARGDPRPKPCRARWRTRWVPHHRMEPDPGRGAPWSRAHLNVAAGIVVLMGHRRRWHRAAARRVPVRAINPWQYGTAGGQRNIVVKQQRIRGVIVKQQLI
jgi:hypothetical protein